MPSGSDGGASDNPAFDWEVWAESGPERARVLVDEKGWKPWDARSIIAMQDQELAARLENGTPIDSFLRSIEADPSTTRVLPEARIAELMAQKDAGLARQAEPAQPGQPEPGEGIETELAQPPQTQPEKRELAFFEDQPGRRSHTYDALKQAHADAQTKPGGKTLNFYEDRHPPGHTHDHGHDHSR